jgi:hypothetical protein
LKGFSQFFFGTCHLSHYLSIGFSVLRIIGIIVISFIGFSV